MWEPPSMEHIPGHFSSVHFHFPLAQMLSKQSSHFTGTEHLKCRMSSVFDDERRTSFYTLLSTILPVCTSFRCVNTGIRSWEHSRYSRCHQRRFLQRNVEMVVLLLKTFCFLNVGDWTLRIYLLDRSNRPHIAECTLGCSGGDCKPPDTPCRIRCTPCGRGILSLFHNKHSRRVRSSGCEISTVKKCDCFVYHRDSGSSRPPAFRQHEHTGGSTPIWWNICTRCRCSCCTYPWCRYPRRTLRQPGFDSLGWRTPTGFSHRRLSAVQDLRQALKCGGRSVWKSCRKASHTWFLHSSVIVEPISVHSSTSSIFQVSP